MMPAETLTWVTDPITFLVAGLILFALSIGYAVSRGGLVPRRTVDTLVAQMDARMTEAQRQWDSRHQDSREREQAWRDAFEATEAARSALSEQVGQLVVIGRTTEALLRALPSASGPPR